MSISNPLKMSDIARLAGVSVSTVSRALSGSKMIPETTRDKIQEIVEQYGYVIDARARNLRLQQSGTIAVIFPLLHTNQAMSDPFFLEMLGHLGDELSNRGYDLLLVKISATEPRDIRQIIQTRRPDGVIVIGQSTLGASINSLARNGTPLVVWGAGGRGRDYVTVGSDNRPGAEALVAHLVRLGRTRIAFFGDTELPEVQERHKGYVAALKAAGLKADKALLCPVSFDERAIGMIETFIAAGVQFDGAFASSDVLAMHLISALRRHGRQVPQDVSVVGFDDIVLASYYSPPLTTARQDIGAAASLMVEKILAQIAGQPVESALLPTEIVVRASCGAAE